MAIGGSKAKKLGRRKRRAKHATPEATEAPLSSPEKHATPAKHTTQDGVASPEKHMTPDKDTTPEVAFSGLIFELRSASKEIRMNRVNESVSTLLSAVFDSRDEQVECVRGLLDELESRAGPCRDPPPLSAMETSSLTPVAFNPNAFLDSGSSINEVAGQKMRQRKVRSIEAVVSAVGNPQ